VYLSTRTYSENKNPSSWHHFRILDIMGSLPHGLRRRVSATFLDSWNHDYHGHVTQ
jgi:hypothetical protein